MRIVEDFVISMGARAGGVRQGREVHIVESRSSSVNINTVLGLQPSGATMTDKASIGGTAGAASGIGGTGHGGITLTMVIAPEER